MRYADSGEFLGVLDQKLVGDDALETLLAAREENVDLILTGKVCPAGAEEHGRRGDASGMPEAVKRSCVHERLTSIQSNAKIEKTSRGCVDYQ